MDHSTIPIPLTRKEHRIHQTCICVKYIAVFSILLCPLYSNYVHMLKQIKFSGGIAKILNSGGTVSSLAN